MRSIVKVGDSRLLAWNPNADAAPWDVERLRELATQPNFPGSGVGASQGPAYSPEIEALLARPQDMSINVKGWVNPYSLTLYTYQLSTTVPTRVLPPNLRRAYLLIQNQGPGNIYVNFGQDVTAPTAAAQSNGLQLITTQLLEQIGGGGIDAYGNPVSNCFISPDYASIITDTVGTTVMIGEGIWRFVTPPGASG